MNEGKQSLEEEKLEEVSGGIRREPLELKTVRWDAKGNPTHWQNYYKGRPYENPFHYVCPHCGRLLHEGAFWRMYCDPCDEGWIKGNLSKTYGIYPGC